MFYFSRFKLIGHRPKCKYRIGIVDSEDNVEEFYSPDDIDRVLSMGVRIEGISDLFEKGIYLPYDNIRAELYVSPYQVYGELDIKAQTLRGVNLLRYKDVVTRLGILTKGVYRLSEFGTSMACGACYESGASTLVLDDGIREWSYGTFEYLWTCNMIVDVTRLTNMDLVADVYFDAIDYFRLVFRIDRLGTKESIDTFIDFFVHDALEKTLQDNLKRFNYFVDLYSNYIRNVSITSKVLERLE